MGHMQAAAYAEAVAEGAVNIEMALAAHLSSNHFPPVSARFVPVAKGAIEMVSLGYPEFEIELPNTYVMTAEDIVEQLHLAAFLPAFDDED